MREVWEADAVTEKEGGISRERGREGRGERIRGKASECKC